MQKESTYEVVVDLETLSLADNCVIASIGAVKIDTVTLKPISTFYRRVSLTGQDKSHIDPGTMAWWNEQDEVPRREVFTYEPRSPIAAALYDFALWLSNVRAVWGNGSRQDIVWLESAYSNYAAVPVPWAFNQARCFRTMSAEFPEVQWHLFEGIAHHALDDVISEAIHLADIWAFKRGQPCPGLRYEDFVRVPMDTHLTAPWQPSNSAGTTSAAPARGKTFEGITLHKEAVAKLLADRGVKAWEERGSAAPKSHAIPHCPGCGEFLEGDGYQVALHCPEVDVDEATPDSGPHFCSGRDEVEALPGPNEAKLLAALRNREELELFKVMAYLSEKLKEHGVRMYQVGPHKFNVRCEGGPDAAKVKGELAKVLAAWDPTHGVSLVTLNAVVDFMNTKLDEGLLNE